MLVDFWFYIYYKLGVRNCDVDGFSCMLFDVF